MRVGIIGAAGAVGSATAFALLLSGTADDIVLADIDEDRTQAQAMDLQQTAADRDHRVSVSDVGGLRGCEVIVITASSPFHPTSSRLDHLEANARILDALAPELGGLNGTETLIVTTAPADPLCTWLVGRIGANRSRVLGYTLNDSIRFQHAVASQLSVPVSAVDGWVIGEHGDHQVPLYSRLRLGGEPVELADQQRSAVADGLQRWFRRWGELSPDRTTAWTTGAGLTRMVAALADDAPYPLPASCVLEGEYGLHGVSLGVPCVLGPGGVERIEEWTLAPEETTALQRSAEVVAAAAGRINDLVAD